jgi:hypothetical protein
MILAVSSMEFCQEIFDERDIREALGGGCGHGAMIPPLSNKGTNIKRRKGKSSRLFRVEANVTTNEMRPDVYCDPGAHNLNHPFEDPSVGWP